MTPSFLPLKSAGSVIEAAFLVDDDLHLAGHVGELHHDCDALVLGLQVDGVVVEADHALHIAGDQRVLGGGAGRLGRAE